jgi:hypothetical protein
MHATTRRLLASHTLALALCACGAADTPSPAQPAYAAPQPAQPASSGGIILVAPPAQLAAPFGPGQTWSGTYQCTQGISSLDLRITGVAGTRVDAVFQFSVPQQGVVGQFAMAADVAPGSLHARFVPGPWIQRPPGYMTVGLEGDVSPDGTEFAGAVTDAAGCTTFSLRRQ